MQAPHTNTRHRERSSSLDPRAEYTYLSDADIRLAELAELQSLKRVSLILDQPGNEDDDDDVLDNPPAWNLDQQYEADHDDEGLKTRLVGRTEQRANPGPSNDAHPSTDAFMTPKPGVAWEETQEDIDELVPTPCQRKTKKLKPKGILKPPRPMPFPEDPNHTREGVAPIKGAGKEVIPSNARWTKINRKIVNPAALAAAQDRFEEGDDHVIVFRVLLREVIEKLAEKTLEVRGG